MIKITIDNYKQIFGQIKKFFDHEDLITWHQFDCGAKKRIGHIIQMSPLVIEGKVLEPGGPFNTMHRMYSVKSSVSDQHFFVEYDMTEHASYDWDTGEIDHDCMVSIAIGDEISFLGNRILIKKEYPIPCHRHQYIYEVFQIGGRVDERKF